PWRSDERGGGARGGVDRVDPAGGGGKTDPAFFRPPRRGGLPERADQRARGRDRRWQDEGGSLRRLSEGAAHDRPPEIAGPFRRRADQSISTGLKPRHR